MNQTELKPKKALLISSSGGHWQQLCRLESAFTGFEKHYACTNPNYHQFVPHYQFHFIPDASQWNKISLVWQAMKVLCLLLSVRPNVVISTGASVGFFALFFAKKMQMKTIWIDSLANAEQMSLSGLKSKPYADLWLTQWEHLSQPDGPYFYGAVL